jgi:hypothetical protein
MDDKPTGGDLPRKWYEIHSEPELPNRSPSAAPVPKVIAGAGGAGIGSALALIAPWLIREATGAEMPVEVALALGSLLSIIGSFVAGYFTPPRSV